MFFLQGKSFFNKEKNKIEPNKSMIVKQLAQKKEKIFDHLLTLHSNEAILSEKDSHY